MTNEKEQTLDEIHVPRLASYEEVRKIFGTADEKQYLNILLDLLDISYSHEPAEDRTGVGTYKQTFATMQFSNPYFPLLTTKRVYWKGVVEELLWFIRGETDTASLTEKGVNIWAGNTTREFLDSRGLYDVPEGDIGAGYGFQWRNWGGDYQKWKETGERTGIDQLQQVIDSLKENPFSRRHIISSWNVSQLDDMALPPCHMMCQFVVENRAVKDDGSDDLVLNCIMYQRSCDFFLGVPFNIASYALLHRLISHYTGIRHGTFQWVGGDVHLYANHCEPAVEQIKRDVRPAPTLDLVNMPDRIEDVTMDNIVLNDYDPHPTIKADMAV